MAEIRVLEQAGVAFTPSASNARIGLIGPATKGAVNQRNTFTNLDALVRFYGRPVDNQHGVRGAIRALADANQVSYVRVAGSLLATATLLHKLTSTNKVAYKFEAISPGTWANNNEVQVIISLNGNPVTSYNIVVLFRKAKVETFLNVTNSTAENAINTRSQYIKLTIDDDAKSENMLPDSTTNSTTGVVTPLALTGGNDGAFADTTSPSSISGGIKIRTSYSYTIADNGLTIYSGDEKRPVTPGSFVIATTAPAETFSDNGQGLLTGGAGGSGRIDYKTGKWRVVFNAAPTADPTVSYTAATLESIGTTTQGTNSYSGTISREGVTPSFIVLNVTRNDILDLGDGTFAAISQTAGTNIVPNSIRIVAKNTSGGEMIVTDDGAGALVGDVASPGTINYTSGAFAFTFEANVGNTEQVVAEYQIHIRDNGTGGWSGSGVSGGAINYATGVWSLTFTLTPSGDFTPRLKTLGVIYATFRHCTVLFTGDAVLTTASGILKEFPVKPGSVVITHGSGNTLTDNGSGVLTGAGGSGTINYFTGVYTATFTSAPVSGFVVRAHYASIKLQVTSIYMGDIGNRREVLTDGLHVHLDSSPSSPATGANPYYRLRVKFGATVVETFDAMRTVAKVLEVVNDATNGSKLVRLSDTGFGGELDTSSTGQEVGMAGAFTQADVIGVRAVPVVTGLQLYADRQTVPMDFISAPGMWHRSVQLAGISLAEARNLVWIASLPDYDNYIDSLAFVNGEKTPTATVPYPPLAAINSSFALCASTWERYFDQYTNKEVYEPCEGKLLAIIARTDRRNSPSEAIAGFRRGGLTNTLDVRYSPSEAERQLMTGFVGNRFEVVNPIIKEVGQGIFLFDEVTMTREDTPLKDLHARWISNIISSLMLTTGKNFLFEQNDSRLWRDMTVFVQTIIQPFVLTGGIYDYNIICDASVNTPDVIQAGKAIALVQIKFTPFVKFIDFILQATPFATNFSEVAPVG